LALGLSVTCLAAPMWPLWVAAVTAPAGPFWRGVAFDMVDATTTVGAINATTAAPTVSQRLRVALLTRSPP
jgi:hypothetical protein